jgi:hypothetical protein
LAGKPEERIPLGIPIGSWEDIIKMHLRAIEWGGMDWIHLAQDMDVWRTLVHVVMNFCVA